MMSEAGIYHKVIWDFDVYDDGQPKNKLGVKAIIQADGTLTNDSVPPNNSFAGIYIILKARNSALHFGGVDMNRFSNDGQGSVVTLNEEHIAWPLQPKPKQCEIELVVSCQVVVDTQPESTADHQSTVRLKLEPFITT